MFALLSSGRVITTRTLHGLCITIRPLRDWRLAFFGVWLVGWIVMPWKAEMNAIESLRDVSTAQWFQLFWGIGWLGGIAFVGFYLLWALGGMETIELTPAELTLNKTIFNVSVRKWNIGTVDVRNLRFSPAYGSGKQRVASRIAFEYKTKTIRFAAELEDGEALAIIDSMLEVYAFPKRDRSFEYIELQS